MVQRTTIEIDEGLLADAKKVLGTTGIKDTVDTALHEVIRRSLRRRLAERIENGTGIDRSPEMLRRTRPTR